MAVWVRFEGPGKLHAHRWHVVKVLASRRAVTLCGRDVYDAIVEDKPGDGRPCLTCARLRSRSAGKKSAGKKSAGKTSVA